MEPTDIVQPYVDYLKEQGYVPHLRDDGLVEFRVEGAVFLLVPDTSDPAFFRVMLPNLWRASDETERREAVASANRATAETKVAKVYSTDQGTVHASIELFSESPEAVTKVFQRSLSALRTAAQNFAKGVATS